MQAKVGSFVQVDIPANARMAEDPRFVSGIVSSRAFDYRPDVATLMVEEQFGRGTWEVSEAWVTKVGHFFDLSQTPYRMFLMKALGIIPKDYPASNPVPKLPTCGTAHNVELEGGFEVYLKQQGVGLGRRRMTHRIFIVCTCGQHVPAGRLRQHFGSNACLRAAAQEVA